MKKWLAIFLLLFSTFTVAAVQERRAISNTNQPLIQFQNNTNYYVSCYYSSQYGFYTFTLAPRHTSRWFILTPGYRWQCRMS